jgi:Uma2 family endonuclease
MLSVAEYEQISDPPGGRYELHHGELVFMPFPVRQHKDLQRRVRKLLENVLEPAGFVVDTEYAYRPSPEYEVWGADVACVRLERHQAIEKWLEGSPELVVEVKSPSNTRTELEDKARTTLAGTGAVQFWIMYPQTRTVAVFERSGSAVYQLNDTISLLPLTAGHVPVNGIFEGIL